MAKKNKSKKSSTTQILSPVNVDDEELMDDLLAELDSRDQTVQTESAAVLQEITESHTVVVEEPSSQTEKQDAKGRFRARQVSVTVYTELQKPGHSSRPGNWHHWRRITRNQTLSWRQG